MEERSYTGEEKSYNGPALIGSLAFHGLLLFIFLFMLLKLPDPPMSEIGGSGVELNFGTSDAGDGDVQTYNQPNNSPEEIQSAPSEVKQETEPQQQQQPEQQVQQSSEQLLDDEEGESVEIKQKDKNEEKKDTDKKNKLKNEKTEASTASNKNTTTANNNTNGTVATIDNRAVMGGNNNGDKDGAVGDQGNPKGSLDAKALYGNQGTGGAGPGGSGGLNLPGWEVEMSSAEDPSDEEGYVKFEFEVDADGNIIGAPVRKEGNVSASTERFYRKLLENAQFYANDRRYVKSRNKGTYTFHIKKR